MATLTITHRTTKRGQKRYAVRYRLGGRGWPVVHAGSFKTLREATERRNLIAGELAAGRNPALLLQALLRPPAPARAETLAELASRYERSRIDYSDETAKNLKSHLKRVITWGGDRDPQAITWADCQEFVATMDVLKPSSVRRYYKTFQLLLDFTGLEPNPARDKRVKLPTVVQEEPQPPTAKQFLAILDSIPRRWPLPLIVMEQTAMTVGEVASVQWGDVDVAESCFRLKRRNVKGAIGARARRPQVPQWLMAEIAATCPLEDRTPERQVFPGFTADGAKNAMARACKSAGIAHFHPHDLRHRRLSLWHGQGVPAKELAERAGHARASMSLDVYSHVLMDTTEVTPEELRSRCGPGVV